MDFKVIFDTTAIKQEFLLALKNSFNYRGKTGRIAFLQFAIGLAILFVGLFFLASLLKIRMLSVLTQYMLILSILPFLAIVSRRFNDKGKKAIGFITLFLLAIVSMILLEVFKHAIPREASNSLEIILYLLFVLSIIIPVSICVRME